MLFAAGQMSPELFDHIAAAVRAGSLPPQMLQHLQHQMQLIQEAAALQSPSGMSPTSVPRSLSSAGMPVMPSLSSDPGLAPGGSMGLMPLGSHGGLMHQQNALPPAGLRVPSLSSSQPPHLGPGLSGGIALHPAGAMSPNTQGPQEGVSHPFLEQLKRESIGRGDQAHMSSVMERVNHSEPGVPEGLSSGLVPPLPSDMLPPLTAAPPQGSMPSASMPGGNYQPGGGGGGQFGQGAGTAISLDYPMLSADLEKYILAEGMETSLQEVLGGRAAAAGMSKLQSLDICKLQSLELPDSLAQAFQDICDHIVPGGEGLQNRDSGLESMQSIEQALPPVDADHA